MIKRCKNYYTKENKFNCKNNKCNFMNSLCEVENFIGRLSKAIKGIKLYNILK